MVVVLPSGPHDGGAHLLAGVRRGDLDLVDDAARQLFAVGVRGGRCLPQRRDVSDKAVDGGQLVRGEAGRAGPGEPLVALGELLPGGQGGFPVLFQLTYYQDVVLALSTKQASVTGRAARLSALTPE